MMEISSRVLLRTGLQIVGIVTIITGICHAIAIWSSLPYSEEMMPMGILVLMGIVIIGGLITSTLLTLVVVPIMYTCWMI